MRPSRHELPALIFLALLLSGSSPSLGNPKDFHRAGSEGTQENRVTFSAELDELASAIRSRDFAALREAFHERVQFGIWLPPVQTAQPPSLVVHSKRLSSNVRGLGQSRADVISSWRTFLNHFRTIEDVRLLAQEVLSAGTDPEWVQDAETQFLLVGNGRDGSRLWVTGSARIDADYHSSRGWRLSRFEVDRIEEYRCPSDHSGTPSQSLR